MNYNVAEIFTSINGEGQRAGELSVFVRFCKCNLRCSYCDTEWANTKDVKFTLMTETEIYNVVKKTGITNVTLTGGEPLLQDGIYDLVGLLSKDNDLNIEIETNGSLPIAVYDDMKNRPSITLDYKLPSSGMEEYMYEENYNHLKNSDTVKFVCGSKEDLNKALIIVQKHNLLDKCKVYFSPVFGNIDPVDMVEFMKTYKLNKARLQLQLHKIIWDPQEQGV